MMFKATFIALCLAASVGVMATANEQQVPSNSTEQQLLTVNLNMADVKALTQLPGIGKKRALAIIAYRDEHGHFSDLDALLNVKGVGKGLIKKLEGKVHF